MPFLPTASSGASWHDFVEAMVRSDDLVIGLSTSGRSPNVIEAIRAARQIGARTVAFLGESGPLADVADLAICIPSTPVPRKIGRASGRERAARQWGTGGS